jgi:hypothetical protein
MKLKHIPFRLIPAILGWLAALSLIAFAMAMVVTSAHAAEPDSSQAIGPAPNTLHCTRHKDFLGLDDGWDCTTTGSATLTLISPTRQPFKLWCDGDGTCKGAGQQVVRSTAFVGVASPVDFDLALRCHIVPPDTDAVCAAAFKAVEAKR